MITNSPEFFSLINTLPLSRLDAHHTPFEITFVDQTPSHDISRAVCKLCFYKTSIKCCIGELSAIDWDHLALTHEIDDFVHTFYNIIYEITEKNTPRTKTRRKVYPLWFTRNLIKLIKNKDKYHHRFKRYGNPCDYDTFSMLRSRVKTVLEQCLRNYICRIESDLSVNIKAFWRYTKSKLVTNTYPKRMLYNGR